LCFGPAAIRWLARHFREPVKSGSAELDRLHQAKQSTPTMGGIFVVAGVLLAVLAIGDIANRAVLLALVVMVGLALLGAIDDFVKLHTRAAGLGWKAKLLGQVCVAAIPAICFYGGWCMPADGRLPLVGGGSAALGWMIIPWTILVIVATSNAVNLTDGLDGLAAGCLLLATLAIGMIAYSNNAAAAPELLVVAGAMVGGLLAFLRFNRQPAQVFMGNVGSLSLGGLLGLLALATGTELLLPLVGGVFVVETASVILQLGVYRWTKKRVLRCAPLHHHSEFLGWPERTIVRRFWLASAACAVVGIALWSLP
jgi:phospho-N-acetylmuramoyl-pentapeptide-transferase